MIMNSVDVEAMVNQAEDAGNRLMSSLELIREKTDNTIRDLENGKFDGSNVNIIGFACQQALREEAEFTTLMKHLKGYELQFRKESDDESDMEVDNVR